MRSHRTIRIGGKRMSKELLNRLNGLKAGEQTFKRLTQEIAEEKTISVDLAALLMDSDKVRGLGFGKEALAKDVNVDMIANRVHIRYSSGKVGSEGSEALQGALHDLVTKSSPTAVAGE